MHNVLWLNVRYDNDPYTISKKTTVHSLTLIWWELWEHNKLFALVQNQDAYLLVSVDVILHISLICEKLNFIGNNCDVISFCNCRGTKYDAYSCLYDNFTIYA